jgi:hypothetical protein
VKRGLSWKSSREVEGATPMPCERRSSWRHVYSQKTHRVIYIYDRYRQLGRCTICMVESGKESTYLTLQRCRVGVGGGSHESLCIYMYIFQSFNRYPRREQPDKVDAISDHYR